MAQNATLNGIVYSIPDVGDNDWGQNVTDYLTAIPGAVLQKSGGAFALTAEVDFGANFGIKSIYFKSRTVNPASAGSVRLAKTDVVSWRNNANGGDLDLGIDAADALTYGSNKVVTVAGGFTLVDSLSFANQKGVRFYEQTGNGTNYMELLAPDAVTANKTLKLPDGVGTAGQVLSTDGVNALSWINAAGGGTINSGSQGRLAVYSSAGTTLDDTVTMTNPVSVGIAAHGQGSVYTIPDTGAATADFVMTAGDQSIAGAKSFTGAMVISAASIAAFNVSNNAAFKVDSTNVLVSIGTATMTHPLHIQKSVTGAATIFALENTEATNAASHAQVQIITGGASAGDPFLTFYNGVTNISVGIDNSDSDALCVTAASTLNGTNILKLTTAGALELASSITAKATTNQIILGVTNTVTITSPAPSASRTYTIPDVGADSSFVLLAGAQTITGEKTFASSTLKLQEVSSTDVVTIAVAALAASRIYTVPDAGGDTSFVMAAGTQTVSGIKTFDTQLIGKGTATNDAAAAGYIGEIIQSPIALAGAVTTVSGQYVDVTNIILTAGDWDISVLTQFTGSGITGVLVYTAIGTAAGNTSTGIVPESNSASSPTMPTSAADINLTIPPYRVSITGSTTYYMKANTTHTIGTIKAYGKISARRVR